MTPERAGIGRPDAPRPPCARTARRRLPETSRPLTSGSPAQRLGPDVLLQPGVPQDAALDRDLEGAFARRLVEPPRAAAPARR
jgi:hypothetical protein